MIEYVDAQKCYMTFYLNTAPISSRVRFSAAPYYVWSGSISQDVCLSVCVSVCFCPLWFGRFGDSNYSNCKKIMSEYKNDCTEGS